MKISKTFQELDLSNAFLFAATMAEPELCRGVLERILEVPIKRVKVHTEHGMVINPELRGIRLDVYADDEENSIYDIEMQTSNQRNLPVRSRFYQAQMDVQFLKSGRRFSELKESYIIFICTFDPFGLGMYRYTFEERCLETANALGDGTHKIFLNTEGKNISEVPAQLVQLLRYIVKSTDSVAKEYDDILLQRLQEKVAVIKRNGEMEAQFMTLEDLMDDAYFEGKTEGKAEGLAESEKNMLVLIERMVADGLSAQLPNLTRDVGFLRKMKENYHLH